MTLPGATLSLRRLGVNIGGTLLRLVTGQGLGLILGIILARGLGAAGNGQYTMVILLPALLSTFLNLGVAPANVYYTGRRSVSVRTAVRTSFFLWAILTAIGLLVSYPLVQLGHEAFFRGVPKHFLWMALAAFPVSLLQPFLASILQGLQDFRRYNSLSLVAPTTTLAMAVVLILGFDLGVVGAVVAFLAGQLTGVIFTYRGVRLHIEPEPERSDSEGYAWKSISYGLKAHLSNIMAFVNYRMDVFLVNMLLTSSSTGIYSVAVQIAERMWVLSQAVSTVLLPKLSELDSDEQSRRTVTPLIARWVFWVTVAGALVVAVIAKPVIALLFGPDYEVAYQPLIWLLPGIAMGSLSKVLANDLAARGRPELNMYLSLVILLVNGIGNVVLIPRYTINGAAMATTIAYGVNAGLKLMIYQRLSGNRWWKPVVIEAADLRLLGDGLKILFKRSG